MHAAPAITTATDPREHDASPLDAPRDVDALLDLDAGALRRLYEGARVPRLSAVAGDLRGRMLAFPALAGPLAAVPRALARSSRFPWRGKSFTPAGEDRGEGVNRVISDRLRLFRFATFIGRSRAGDFDAVQLDYDNPGNPFFIRPIKDEIRELRPGLYLGQAYLAIGGAERLVLYFGLEAP
jgi:hypothetical protein